MNTVINKPMVEAGGCPARSVKSVNWFVIRQALARRQADHRSPGLKRGSDGALSPRPVSPLRFARF